MPEDGAEYVDCYSAEQALACVAAERERAAVLVETLTYRQRWVMGGINSGPVKPCALAAAIRAG